MTVDRTTGDAMLANLEGLYPLSPMQQGMLFHSLYSPRSGVYFEQSVFTIKGDLEVTAFERAWQTVVGRHSILRTAFLWEDLEKPVQTVQRHVELPIARHDWRDHLPSEHEGWLQSFISADRDRGFKLSQAPLMRIALIRYADDEYKFVLSRHHMVLDRWSRALLLKEFFAIYHALSSGREPTLDVPRPYSDYIAWLSRQDAGAAERFWRTTLAGFTVPTPFAVDRTTDRPDEGARPYADQRIQLSEAATEKVQAFARQHRLTLNTVAQGAWALLLARYSGTDNVIFGVSTAGRPADLPGVESMVGLCINTLPLRVQVPRSGSVRSWLQTVQERQVALQRYEYSSLLDIHGWSDVPRALPLFESIFVFENLPVVHTHHAASGGIEFREDRGIGSTTGYPLTVLVHPASRLTIQVVYDRARFDEASIWRLLRHFATLLESLAADAEPISRLPMLTQAEREQILIQWNNTSAPSTGVPIQSLFESRVEHTPDATAVVFDGHQLSYRQLNDRANQLAHHLRKLHVGPDVKVAICLHRSLDMVIAVLATVKAGGAYVPLDPDYPRERVRFMLEDARCPVLLTSKRVAENLPETGAAVLCLDCEWNRIALEPTDNTAAIVDEANLAYVIYTSGSTGQPKGVGMTRRALSNLMCWQLDAIGTFPAARTLQFASLGFDVSFQEIFSTWCSGGTLILIAEELRRDAGCLLQFLADQQVERLFVPFVFLQHLADAAEQSMTFPPHLREIITAGEQLEITPHIAAFCSRLNDCTLHNHYGPSETHVVTAYSLTSVTHQWPRLPSIGQPIANTQIYVLDENLEPLPVGARGQLCVAGASLSRGYLNRPAPTAEKFRPNPFSKEPGGRLYMTGDLARYDGDGKLEFLGRVDSQVKIRGFRVEPGEIEAILLSHPSVRQAAVVARQDTKGDRILVAYVVTDVRRPDGLSAELRTYLAAKLPAHMIPSAFVIKDALPLTPSGKVDRRSLPAADPQAIATDVPYEAPRSANEEKLAELWSSVLRRERIGIRDNFFELGGHSLLATQLISRVRSAFNVEMPLRHLFETPTVAELAALILEFQKKAEARAPSPITRDTDRDACDLLANIDHLTNEQVERLMADAPEENNQH